MFAVGTLVAAGKYRVDRVIGRGGMGVVIGATHLALQQRVALKFLMPDLVASKEIAERFVREARASAQLRGEHVCRVSDVGTEGGAPYIVMELLEGRDLTSLLEANGSLPVARAADYVLQACVGVAEAHALGIVHRDLKPGNLFLTRRPDGTPLIKVLDFGIAKAPSDQSFTLTQTSTILGSPIYMSPEQLRSSRDADVRSDVWSFGVILYELVSGRRPFPGESLTELTLRIAMDTPLPLDGHIPRGFEAIALRCLAKDPAQRYSDLAGLAAALAEYAGPAGRERATAVARLLGRGSRAPLDESDRTQRSDGPAGMSSTTQPEITGSDVGGGRASPTTIGSAAGSMATGSSSKRRWGVVAGTAVTVVFGAIATIAIVRGDRGNRGADPGAPATAPGSSGSAASLPADAGAAPIDAAARAPIDAGARPFDAAVPVDAAAPKGPKGSRQPAGRGPKQPINHDPEDYGATQK